MDLVGSSLSVGSTYTLTFDTIENTLPRTLVMSEAVPAGRRVRNVIVCGHVNTFHQCVEKLILSKFHLNIYK